MNYGFSQSSTPITFGSVCSGIEAASVAWEPLGWRAAWFAEIEPFPCRLLAYHYPTVPNLGNMLDIPRMLRDGTLIAPDVFTGGTPCQAFSIAGLRLSLGDARGNLSMTFCEIANEIDIQRAANGLLPCVIKWENVPGVLTTEDNAFGCFLAGLAGEDEALVPEPQPPAGKSSRYWKWNKKTGKHSLGWSKCGVVIGPQRAVAWRVLDAQYFGVAQRRRRVFVVASARAGFDPAAVLFEFDGVRRDSAPSRSTQEDLAGTIAGGARRRGGYSCDDLPLTAGTLRGTDGGADVDHARAGHLQPVDAAGVRVHGMPGDERADLVAGMRMVQPRPDSSYPIAFGGNNQAGPIDIATACRAHASPHLDFESETFLVQPVAATLDASYGRLQGCSGQDSTHGHSHLVPIAFDARQDCVSSTEVFGALGSSSPQAQAVCVTGDITLKAEGFDASEDGTGRGQPIVAAFQERGRASGRSLEINGDLAYALTAPAGGGRAQERNVMVGMAVRRLTPRECERLQGFQWRCAPDHPGAWQDGAGCWWSPDYTLIPGQRRNIDQAKLDMDYIKYLMRGGVRSFEDCMDAAADGPRYKGLGNSWAVPKVRWIGARINAQLMKQMMEFAA